MTRCHRIALYSPPIVGLVIGLVIGLGWAVVDRVLDSLGRKAADF